MIDWVVMTLVASTLLMLAVLLVRRPVMAMFGPRIAYALWALPALRLVLPALPGWQALFVPVAFIHPGLPWTVGIVDPATAFEMTGGAPREMTVGHPEAMTGGHFADVSVEVTGAPYLAEPWLPGLAEIAVAVWLAGAVLWLGWQLLRYRLYVRRALEEATLLTRTGGTEVFVSAGVTGPVAAGIRRPLILLPADFTARYTPAEQRQALLHEGAHHDRGDLLANLVALGGVALHWWNPIAHLAYRAFRTDQELACDATVLAGAAAGERAAYGSAVLKSACTATPAAACALRHKTELKQRIGMMKPRRRGALRLAAGAATVAALIGGGLLVTAAGMAPPEPAPPGPPMAPEPIAFVMPPVPIRPAALAAPVPAAAPVAPALPAASVVPALPAASVAPALPATVATPAAPAAPPAPAGVAPARRVVVRTVHGRDGAVLTEDFIGADIEREVEAALAEAGFGDGDRSHPVRVVINRQGRNIAIAADGVDAVELAECITRVRTGRGLTVTTCSPGAVSVETVDVGDALRRAREEIAGSRHLSDEQRRRALAGIDAAIAGSRE